MAELVQQAQLVRHCSIFHDFARLDPNDADLRPRHGERRSQSR
jgi:hypothetical protein